MFCSKCGAKLGENDKFCKKCGNSISEKKGGDEKKSEDKPKESPTIIVQTPSGQNQQNQGGCLSCFYGGIIFLTIFGAIGTIGYGSSIGNSNTITIGLLTNFFFFALAIVGLVQLGRRNRQKLEQTTVIVKPSSDESNQSPDQPKKPKSWRSTVATLSVIMIIIFFVMLGYFADVKNNKGAAISAILLFLSFALFIFTIWPSIVKLIKAFKERPWRTSFITGGIILIIILPIAIIVSIINGKNTAAFNTFHDTYADVLSAKYLGDDILAGKSSADFASVKTAADLAMKNLPDEQKALPSDYTNYTNAVKDWVGKIDAAAASKKSWKDLPDPPANLQIAENSTDIDIFYNESLNRVAAVKDYGDWAAAKGDKDTMRQVAAELTIEGIFQSGLTSTTATSMVQSAEAAGLIGRTAGGKPVGGCRGTAPCSKKTGPIVLGLGHVARNYSIGDANVGQWNDAWNQAASNIKITGNNYPVEAGIKPSIPDTTKPSPMEQAFSDQCKAKGGTVGGTGGVKDRLPTTLTAGTLNCDYKNNGNTCWDVMTPTGQRYLGGNNGCPEENLVSKPAPVQEKKTTTDLNGSYKVNWTQGSCHHVAKYGNNYSQPDSWYSSTLASPHSDTIKVSGGKVMDPLNNWLTIDASGNASSNFTPATGTTISRTYHFTNSNGTYQVSGTDSMKVAPTAYDSISCTQSFGGQK